MSKFSFIDSAEPTEGLKIQGATSKVVGIICSLVGIGLEVGRANAPLTPSSGPELMGAVSRQKALSAPTIRRLCAFCGQVLQSKFKLELIESREKFIRKLVGGYRIVASSNACC